MYNNSKSPTNKNKGHDKSPQSAVDAGGGSSSSSSDSGVPVWYTLKDQEGHIYYYNEITQESSWEPPEWVEETDPESGHNYYLCTKHDANSADPDTGALKSTWTAPKHYAIIVPLQEE